MDSYNNNYLLICHRKAIDRLEKKYEVARNRCRQLLKITQFYENLYPDQKISNDNNDNNNNNHSSTDMKRNIMDNLSYRNYHQVHYCTFFYRLCV